MRRARAFTAQVDTLRARLTGPERDRWLQQKAREAVAEAEAINARTMGRAPQGTTRINGRPGRLEDMRGGKVLSHVFAVQNAVVDFVFEHLAAMSPYDTGDYLRAHRMLVNGDEQDPPVDLSVTDEVTFVNTAPYARRIEHGWSDQAPDGVYEVVWALARRRYGGVADIGFSYVQLAGGREGRFPAITISPKGSRGVRM